MNTGSNCESGESKAASQIDFAKYQTEELTQRLLELVGIPGAVLQVAKVSGFVTVFALIVCAAVDAFTELSSLPQSTLYLYALIAGSFVGFLLGLLGVVTASLRHIEEILAIALETTDQISLDLRQVRSGHMQLPGGGVILHQVYWDVLLPVLESVVGECFGVLGRPVMFAYRWTLGSAVSRLIRMAQPPSETTLEAAETAKLAVETMDVLDANRKEIDGFVKRVSGLVEAIGRRIRAYVITPLWLAFLAFATLAIVPWLGILYWYIP